MPQVVLQSLATQCYTTPYIEYGTTYPTQECVACYWMPGMVVSEATYEIVYDNERMPLCAKHAEQAERELRDAT